jgi:pilus assembly protein CpaD
MIRKIENQFSEEIMLKQRDELPGLRGTRTKTMTNTISLDRTRVFRAAATLVGLAAMLAACTHTDEVVTASVPNDYRQRHPIAITEADQSMVIFVGNGRGGLSPAQRADVVGLAQTWLREGTGAIVADVPVGTPNAQAAAASYQETRALLASAGVPPRGITLHQYHPDDPRALGTIRLRYPKIAAVAGPCGLWPEDLGPSIKDKSYSENKEYYNLGCASQRNLAAMIDNPSDLVQPRSETPAYTVRRTEAFEKYRKGETSATIYPESEKAKLSDTSK